MWLKQRSRAVAGGHIVERCLLCPRGPKHPQATGPFLHPDHSRAVEWCSTVDNNNQLTNKTTQMGTRRLRGTRASENSFRTDPGISYQRKITEGKPKPRTRICCSLGSPDRAQRLPTLHAEVVLPCLLN